MLGLGEIGVSAAVRFRYELDRDECPAHNPTLPQTCIAAVAL